ncbi:hypothetical protein DSO57_1016093 [Entomophthora muscae]|uniref:Uncharacterized protein n=1 Tax=Entomophthora muscae TaxID=34485 RepID=A0ACC2RW11_9FUNG|nr:hypothetical protein DSO57_1016093 [Entomophthora muscae]
MKGGADLLGWVTYIMVLLLRGMGCCRAFELMPVSKDPSGVSAAVLGKQPSWGSLVLDLSQSRSLPLVQRRCSLYSLGGASGVSNMFLIWDESTYWSLLASAIGESDKGAYRKQLRVACKGGKVPHDLSKPIMMIQIWGCFESMV